ncbi:MAG: hypothetical protein WA624_17500 [Methylocella sp.]
MSRMAVCLSLAFALIAVSPVARAQARFQIYFLSAGSSFYVNPDSNSEHGFENLPGANASARLVADILSRNGAVAGITLTSTPSTFVSRDDFEGALSAIGVRLRSERPTNPLLVVYFAGHGISEGIAWNHFSVPGNFVYGAPLEHLDIEQMARHTIHAAALAEELDQLGVPYLLLLDTCYSGQTADFSSPVLSPTAISNLRDIAAILRYTNEFHQPNPIIFSARPGTEVPLAPDPRDDRQSLGPIARRLLLVSRAVDAAGARLTLSAIVRRLTSASLDSGTSAPITNATPPLRDDIVLGGSGSPQSTTNERQGTGKTEDLCCGPGPSPGTTSPGSRLRGALVYEGPPGEFVSGGRRVALSAGTEVTVEQPDLHSVELAFTGPDSWELDLSVPDGSKIEQGRYMAAQRYAFEEAGRPGLSLAGAGRTCNEVSGEFTITMIARDASGKLAGLDAEFSQACDGSSKSLRGGVKLGTQ